MHDLFREKNPILRTERLTLRPFSDGDLEPALEIFNSKEVTKTYMLPDFPDREAAVKMFLRLKALSETEDRFVYAVCREDKLIGFLNEVDTARDAVEVGYVITPSQWNNGYATEALRAAVDELFRLGISTVKAGYFEGNAASRRVMEKAGMIPTGEYDEIEYRGETHRCPYMEIRK